MTIKSKSIRYINWETEEVQPGNEYWVLPQLVAQIGSHWPIVRSGETYSATQTIRNWAKVAQEGALTLESSPISLAGVKKVVGWLNTSPRGDLMTGMTQTKDTGIRWSAPVPLVLSAFKEFREVGYSSWDWTDPGMVHLVDRDMWEYSQHFHKPLDWDSHQLLLFRSTALEVKTGRQQGTVRKPESTSQVYGVQDPGFKALPRLMKLALTQLWCFHPKVRTTLMITNPLDLDHHPPALVDDEVVQPLGSVQPIQPSPWDL